ncbi:MAG: hypothetical protein ACRC5T_12975 [Cetobacterium sp.]
MKQIFLLLLLFNFFIGCTNSEFNRQGIHKQTKTKYDILGFDKFGYNQTGFDINGYSKTGFDKNDFDKFGIHKQTKTKYDILGFNKDGFNKDGFNKDGFNKNGFNKNGFSEEGLKFHNAAWFQYFDFNPTSFEVYNLTYDANDRKIFFHSFKPKPIEVKKKMEKGLRNYRKNIIIKEIDTILEDNNFKNYSNPLEIVKRDLKIKKQLDFIYNNKKIYETEFDLINRNLKTLEQFKQTFDKIAVFQKKVDSISYDPYKENLIIFPGTLIDLTKKNTDKYLGSNAFGMTAKVSMSYITGSKAILKKIEKTTVLENEKIVINIPKTTMANYNLKNFNIEYLTITNKINKIKNGTIPTLDIPFGHSYNILEVTYEVIGIKLKYDGKIIYKENFLKGYNQ